MNRPAPEPPSILVLDAGAPGGVLREVCAGAEEEGVPVQVAPATGAGADCDGAGAGGLAHVAAGRSRLQVGVGLGRDGSIAVTHGTLPEHSPALHVPGGDTPGQWRRAGRVAARIVTHLPLR